MRAEDAEFYQSFKNKNFNIGAEMAEKRKRKQECFRAKRKRWMEVHFRAVNNTEAQPNIDYDEIDFSNELIFYRTCIFCPIYFVTQNDTVQDTF